VIFETFGLKTLPSRRYSKLINKKQRDATRGFGREAAKIAELAFLLVEAKQDQQKVN
jgi:hypothetical protein